MKAKSGIGAMRVAIEGKGEREADALVVSKSKWFATLTESLNCH